ncbi:MAG: hypothetical protein HY674_02485 [Chloroflexi bacterium]|nr:hypothetical protein [Chloroflexota bacterium]
MILREPNQCIPKWSVPVAAAILAAVEGGILPPDPVWKPGVASPFTRAGPPGRMPGSTVGRDACRYRQLWDAPAPDSTLRPAGATPALPAVHE